MIIMTLTRKNDYNNNNYKSNNNYNSASDNYEKQRSCFTENVACPLVVQVRERGKGKKEFHERIF